MESIQFEFIVQPDYICYGVKAHYFKVSGIVCHRNGNGGMYWDVFSVIINQQTGASQRQGKIKIDWKHVKNAAYGATMGRLMCGTAAVGKWYASEATQQQKDWYNTCLTFLHGALYKVNNGDAMLSTGSRVAMRKAVDDINAQLQDLKNGAQTTLDIGTGETIWTQAATADSPVDGCYVMGVPSEEDDGAKQEEAPAEFKDIPDSMLTGFSTEEFTEIVNGVTADSIYVKGDYEYRYEKELKRIQYRPATGKAVAAEAPVNDHMNADEIRVRKAKTMARMVNSAGLTAFMDGNLYDIVDGSARTFNGRRYVSVVNDNGDECFLDDNRIKLEMVYVESPAND